MRSLFFSFVFFMIGSMLPAAVDVFPPLPEKMHESDLYEVFVQQEGKTHSSYVYKSVNDSKMNRRPMMTQSNNWTAFAFDGKVSVIIKMKKGKIEKATIRPLSRKISCEIVDDSVRLTLDHPENLLVEIKGQERNPLFLFPVKIDKNHPTAETADTHYFGPGIHQIDEFVMKKPNLYLAGGAYVKGNIRFDKSLQKKKVKIGGPGILSGIDYSHEMEAWDNHQMIKERSGKMDIEISDITLTDASGANIMIWSKLFANNIKILAWASCSDGIGGGKNSVIRGCFLKTMDDNIHITRDGTKVYDTVHYLEAHGSAFVMGWSVNHDTTDVYINGVDLIGDIDTFRNPAYPPKEQHYNHAIFTLNNMKGTPEGEGIHYHHLVAENVRSEIKNRMTIAIQIKNHFSMKLPDGSIETYNEGLGHVSDLVFRNFTIMEKPLCRSVFDGNGDKDGSVKNITFENYRIEGELLTEENADKYIIRKGKTSDFHYKP
ncbi:MAG: hypothetical protein Q4G69_14785 [Planctomycetia bacterium]|nr:hypothetical protein [Planctomycetia bacterium]